MISNCNDITGFWIMPCSKSMTTILFTTNISAYTLPLELFMWSLWLQFIFALHLNACTCFFISQFHVCKFYYPSSVLAFRYCHLLRLWACVSVCVYQSLACQNPSSSSDPARIIRFDQTCKTHWVRFLLLFWGWGGGGGEWVSLDLELQGQMRFKIPNLPHFKFVRIIVHHLITHSAWMHGTLRNTISMCLLC